MNLQITVNEATPTTPTPTPGNWQVAATYTGVSSPQTFGPFGSREAAEQCAVALAAKTNVLGVTITEV